MSRFGARLAPVVAGSSLVLAIACDERIIPTAPLTGEQCVGYPAEASSEDVLPYPVGESRLVTQGNCTNASHQGSDKYAYDFDMPIGSEVTAIRDGVVVFVEEGFSDFDRRTLAGNVIFVLHGDGTGAEYVHLTRDGALVAVGQAVRQGEVIGLSGASGRAGSPHLHLGLLVCTETADGLDCMSLPLTFRNASPSAPSGLRAGVSYTALPHDGPAPG